MRICRPRRRKRPPRTHAKFRIMTLLYYSAFKISTLRAKKLLFFYLLRQRDASRAQKGVKRGISARQLKKILPRFTKSSGNYIYILRFLL